MKSTKLKFTDQKAVEFEIGKALSKIAPEFEGMTIPYLIIDQNDVNEDFINLVKSNSIFEFTARFEKFDSNSKETEK